MNKLFFLLLSMNVGGVEKSFLRLLSTLPPEQYEIHLGLIKRKGDLLEQVPDYVHIHDISIFDELWSIINDPPSQTITRLFKEGRWWQSTILLILYFVMKLTGSSYWTYRYLLRKEPVFPIEFDVAIAYAGPAQMIDYYICEKTNAAKKYGWIHFDISQFGIDAGLTRRLYQKYDKIIFVSNEARTIFVNRFPEFAAKSEVYYTIIDPNQIRQQAVIAPTFSDNFYGKRILTVGRISKEKGQQIALFAMKQLKSYQPNVRWYFVGEGNNMAECQELVQKENLEGSIVFLGLQENPYGFMRDCDLYVQPSLHEGYCITLAEALCFNKPVVTTAFAGAREQLDGKKNAWIADFNPESLAEKVLFALSSLE